MSRLPVNVITGFLGSGKTTAIIRLLSQKESPDQWAVIINEFGKISIDGQTLRSSGQAEVFEVSGGCICCSAKGYFKENLDQIVQRGIYSRIIIEPTGLGGIDMVSEIVIANPLLQLMPVVCLVDSSAIRNPRLPLIPIFRNQILKSDIILFSKCDLISSVPEQQQLFREFKSSYPDKHLYGNTSDLSSFSALLNLDFDTIADENKFSRMFPFTSDTTTGFHQKVHVFKGDLLFDKERIARFFNSRPSIIRAKGHLHTPKGWMLVNFSFSGCCFESCEEKLQNEMILIWSDKTNF